MEDREGVRYENVDAGYFEARGLRRHAGVVSLWALGVGSVISGDFFGWNFGLRSGGFGGMLAALAIVIVMYAGLCFSIAEMSAALPHTGGAYSFARSAMGPWGAYVTGLAENMEYVLTPAVIVVGIEGYLRAVFGTPEAAAPLWWAGCYAFFVGINVLGAGTSFRFTVLVTVIALGILVVFWIGAVPHLALSNAVPGEGLRAWLPHGVAGIFGSLPFAMWFFLAIEELPLAAEEAHDPKRDLPRGLLYGLLTLVVAGFLTLITAACIAPGAAVLATSNEPLFEGFRTIFGAGIGARVLALLAVAGLVASFHGIVFACGRQIYSLSRAGYFPRWLSVTHPTRKTPHVALIVGAVLGFAAACAIHALRDEGSVAPVLLNMAVFGAVIAYVLQMVSFLLLRARFPGLERPYRSRLGVPGAAVALVLALVTLVTLFVSDPTYLGAVVGAAVWYALGLAYFAFYARRRLVLSPEEEFAMGVRTEPSAGDAPS